MKTAAGPTLYQTEGKNAHTDVSVAGWQIQALKACSHTNIKFKGMTSCISKGLDYINKASMRTVALATSSASTKERARSASTEPESDYFTLTGVGMLCNQMWGKGQPLGSPQRIQVHPRRVKVRLQH